MSGSWPMAASGRRIPNWFRMDLAPIDDICSAASACGPCSANRARSSRVSRRTPAGGRSYLRSGNLDMPLSSDGGAVDTIMVVGDFGRR